MSQAYALTVSIKFFKPVLRIYPCYPSPLRVSLFSVSIGPKSDVTVVVLEDGSVQRSGHR
jgi:hypothetical protein